MTPFSALRYRDIQGEAVSPDVGTEGKAGIRASAPNEWWHVDVTIIRLLDGTRAYLHGIVDNYSRRVLAWNLEERLCAEGTRKILTEARKALAEGATVRVMTDGGSENLIVHQDAAVADHVDVVNPTRWSRPSGASSGTAGSTSTNSTPSAGSRRSSASTSSTTTR